MQPFRQPSRRAAYQPKEPKPAPRSIPDQAFNELFAGLASNRDRALIAFWISTGARAAELLGVVQGLLAPEDQTIGVVRKGSQALQHLPASADAFVWLRLYQQEMLNLVPRGPAEPVWWTLHRPFRPLTYDAARMVFTRVNQLFGANWTLHDLRHSAAKRMLRDSALTLVDIILSFRVSQGCDLRCPVVDSVADETPQPDRDCFTSSDRYLIELRRTAGRRARGRAGDGAGRSHRRAACCGRGRR
jgi:integrase